MLSMYFKNFLTKTVLPQPVVPLNIQVHGCFQRVSIIHTDQYASTEEFMTAVGGNTTRAPTRSRCREPCGGARASVAVKILRARAPLISSLTVSPRAVFAARYVVWLAPQQSSSFAGVANELLSAAPSSLISSGFSLYHHQ